jgi:hypothetical protein
MYLIKIIFKCKLNIFVQNTDNERILAVKLVAPQISDHPRSNDFKYCCPNIKGILIKLYVDNKGNIHILLKNQIFKF